ncbi:hypothetical protein ASPZODRAFT_59139 [Penicilliopsis zonata CBS 506.65]|uniref:Major facilitator superfamily transporter n=1 Tax=Penicilliopsis zonata CBS 506.65 TaxID=1073090 RepID=A0A1L9SRQ6_9EURO|nr:hypothetical protein ASPZODRAFT_59139 [Penicilliopsis zonata CBS 506.65]OJJ49783.1 hypothetical protein ASPZODRAFT_59139 [Penicilliopsis zonata CBS 506.65]
MPVQARRHSSAYQSQPPHARDVEKLSHYKSSPQQQQQQQQHHHHHHQQQIQYHHNHRRRDSTTSESEDDSLSSSAPSYQPIMNGAVRRARGGGPGIFYRVPNRIMRKLCLGLLVALILFIGSLFRFTLPTVTPVPLELPKPISKPPPWESFPFLKRYHGGVRSLVSRKENVPEYPGDSADDVLASHINSEEQSAAKRDQKSLTMSSEVFNPYPDYASEAYQSKYGEKRECFLNEAGTVRLPRVQSFPGVPQGFPDAVMGSNEMIGIRDDVCFDRFGRLGPYGLGYGAKRGGSGAGLEGDREGAERVWDDYPPVDFREVSWAKAQNHCAVINSHRFADLPEPRLDRFLAMPIGSINVAHPVSSPPQDAKNPPKVGTDRLPRTAVIIRTWSDFQYTTEDILYLRSLISELSLLSGGEYTVHFLIHVKDLNLQIWADDDTYERVLHDALPEEFRGMGTLWSEKQMELFYPGLEETLARGLAVHGVYRSTFMPMQYFSYVHPEYDYYWNWEMDVRYTGHWYHLFDKVTGWAKQQPRKGLWERNARFYVPSRHGSWDDFRQMVRVQTELGTDSPNNLWSAVKLGGSADQANDKSAVQRQVEKFVWGPLRPHERDILEVEGEGIPPTTIDKDNYKWGVGEDADLIVFNPLYDPEGTTWLLRDDVTGYNRDEGMPPRRTAIITASRLSRKLLHTMHKETALKRHTMFSEMWPATTALHHGFKAVYVPHSVYIDRRWPTEYLESVFNAGRNGASGGARTAVFGDREHNFKGTTWFYSAGFAPNLWRRWLGYKVDNDGGEEEELVGEGRMCLPPILFHPVKSVNMVIDDGLV